jgi:hypothetical protein
MTMRHRFLCNTAAVAAVLGLLQILPAGAALAATGSPRGAVAVRPAGYPWIFAGTYQYLSDCDRAGKSYAPRQYRCERDAPVYDLWVYYT